MSFSLRQRIAIYFNPRCLFSLRQHGNTGSNSTPYSPQTEKEKEEAYKLLDDFLRELAKQQAFRELVVRHAANWKSSAQGKKGGNNDTAMK